MQWRRCFIGIIPAKRVNAFRRFGRRENLAAIAFLKHLNEVVHAGFPGVLMAAEEIDFLAGGIASDIFGWTGIHTEVESWIG